MLYRSRMMIFCSDNDAKDKFHIISVILSLKRSEYSLMVTQIKVLIILIGQFNDQQSKNSQSTNF